MQKKGRAEDCLDKSYLFIHVFIVAAEAHS